MNQRLASSSEFLSVNDNDQLEVRRLDPVLQQLNHIVSAKFQRERHNTGIAFVVLTTLEIPIASSDLYCCRRRGKTLALERLVAETSRGCIGSVEAWINEVLPYLENSRNMQWVGAIAKVTQTYSRRRFQRDSGKTRGYARVGNMPRCTLAKTPGKRQRRPSHASAAHHCRRAGHDWTRHGRAAVRIQPAGMLFRAITGNGVYLRNKTANEVRGSHSTNHIACD